MKHCYLLLAAFFAAINISNAQCGAGEVPVTLDISTDMYGYEIYWELVPGGNACGVGTIDSGGSALVGCAGAGGQLQDTSVGYGDHVTITEGPWCLQQDSTYTIIYTDDWGDGGAHFTVYIDGYPMYSELTGWGDGPNGTYLDFNASLPLVDNIGVLEFVMPLYVGIGATSVQANIFNFSSTTVTSFDFNYSVNGGSTVTENVTGVNVAPFTPYLYNSSTPLAISSNGSYQIVGWVSNPNGLVDMDASNDSATVNVEAGPPVPNLVAQYINLTPTKTVVATSADLLETPRDLDFHPVLTRNELWVVNKETESYGGTTVTLYNAGEANQTSLWRKDGNSWHFMSLPTGIAFSDNGNFATSPGVFDSNHQGNTSYFTGPALWTSDSLIYAQPSGGNGSHLDMLHESPYSMGICNEVDNVFWLFDGYHNAPVRYDFGLPHVPGGDDHSDGIIRRYAGLGLAPDPAHHIASHLVLDETTGWLYIVDTGNDRVLRMDINSGMAMANLPPHESVIEFSEYGMVIWQTVADTGFVEPSGVELLDNFLLVSDHANGDITVYDISSTPVPLGKIHTNDPGIMGIKIGPDGKLWYVNATNNEVVRLELPAVMPVAQFSSDTNGVCPGGCIQFIDQSTDAVTYEWLFQGGSPVNSTESNPFVCYSTSGVYDVKLIVTNSDGADTIFMNNYITIYALPIQPVITQSGSTLSISNSEPYIFWYLNGEVIDTAIGLTSYVFTEPGTYSVLLQNANGCVATSDPYTAILAPQALFTANTTTICPAYCIDFINQSTDAVTYLWQFAGGDITTDTAAQPQVCYFTPGTYDVTLIVTNAFGPDTLHITDYITINPAPATPIIQQNGNWLSVPDTFSSYQWYNGTGSVSGVTDSSAYEALENGSYYVIVNNSLGCEATSNTAIYTGVEEVMNDADIELYPNPTKAFVTVSSTKLINRLELIDVTGRVVMNYTIENHKSVTLNLEQFSNGAYILKVFMDNGLALKRLAVIR